MIKPTIGRKVWYYPSAHQLAVVAAASILGKMIQRDPGRPFDATITYVHSDSMVNLAVRDHDGHSHAVTSVQLLAPEHTDNPPTGSFYARWMDFQIGQAKAADAAAAPAPASEAPGAPPASAEAVAAG